MDPRWTRDGREMDRNGPQVDQMWTRDGPGLDITTTLKTDVRHATATVTAGLGR